ncbi:aldo/keto reductase [Saccharicrinis sp. FJH62]|uniref:aldo/keto reductase n=1 Tax=Saccharicrinis sp. FJH62 TaxID=3344657 RepID=UPI0035D3FA10
MNITDLAGTVTLNNGVEMPYLGLGVYLTKDGEEVETAVLSALEAGYRHIDTASFYHNEAGVGNALAKSDVDRKDIFITTKVWNSDQGYEKTLKAFEVSLKKLQMDFLDLYLVHWPVKGKFTDTWRAFEKLYKEGLIRAIGVSNFHEVHLTELLKMAEVIPAVNQVEFHPYLVQQSLVDFCKSKGIQHEAWSPLMQGGVLDVMLLNEIGKKYGKSPVQVTLRWNLQRGTVTIPKSVHPERIRQNVDIFDFELSEEEMRAINALDRNQRVGPDPENFNF